MRFFQVAVLCVLVCVLPADLLAQSSEAAPDEGGFALLVDVSNYRDTGISSLRWKSSAVDKVKSALSSEGGFPEGQVRVLAGESATREGIIESLTAIVESARMKANARFFLYIKGRSSMSGGKGYFLPYDARVGALSTYIGETEIASWLNRLPFKKMLIQAAWNVDDAGDMDFSSTLAGILGDAKTDADGNRNVTLAEVEAGIRALNFSGNYPIRISGDAESAMLRLPSALEVTSEPSGAAVMLDDMERGITPARIVALTPGTHKLHVKKELYRISTEQTIEIASARGQRVIASPYQLTPIRVYGTVSGVDRDMMKDVELRIEGTAYQKAVTEDGAFSFENWQAYGLLEAGKTYRMLARSSDGLYSGEASFTFSGMDDIRLGISLAQSNWIEMAMQRLAAGDNDGAVAMLDAKLQASAQTGGSLLEDREYANIQPALAGVFLTHIGGKLESEPDNLGWRVMAARLADIAGDVPAARRHWKVVKASADEGTAEYDTALTRLRQTDPMRQPWAIGLIIACVIAALIITVLLLFYIRKRIRLSKYREIPNPYIAGKPISERDMFFGREDVFAFIKGKFSRDAKDITIVLYGGRRTGKTSIMNQIAGGRLGDAFMPVFIDMQELAGVDTHDFFRIIAQKISDVYRAKAELTEGDRAGLEELYSNLEDRNISAYRSFSDFLVNAASRLEDRYIILLIDEYELLERKVNEGDMTDEIFSYLRHLMQNLDNLAFIFSGSRPFGERERREWDFVFNMAQPLEVSFLSRDNAIALITEPVKDYMRYDRKALEHILRLTAGHPFFTQALCLQLVDDLNDRQENKVTIEYVDEACHEIVENAPFHLPFLWRELTGDEKVMVALLAEILPDESAYASVDDIISRQSYYELEYDRADISKTMTRLTTIEEHLLEKKSGTEAYRFRVDLIRSWIKAEHPTWGALKEVQNHE